MNLPPDHVPALLDKKRLAVELCVSPDTVDSWVERNLLPEGMRVGGKTMWEWKTVREWVVLGKKTQPESPAPGDVVDRIREATRKAVRR